MGWLRKLGAVLIGVACLFAPAHAHVKFVPTNPCDDGMGRLPIVNGTLNDGSSLRRVWNVTNDTAVLPKDVKWVGTYMNRILKSQGHIDDVMSWPRDVRLTNCKLRNVTYNKLCVPKKTKRGFRVKVHLNTKCGAMHVRYRVAITRAKKPVVLRWGRSAS